MNILFNSVERGSRLDKLARLHGSGGGLAQKTEQRPRKQGYGHPQLRCFLKDPSGVGSFIERRILRTHSTTLRHAVRGRQIQKATTRLIAMVPERRQLPKIDGRFSLKAKDRETFVGHLHHGPLHGLMEHPCEMARSLPADPAPALCARSSERIEDTAKPLSRSTIDRSPPMARQQPSVSGHAPHMPTSMSQY